MASLLSISEVNKLDNDEFDRLFKNVIELWPDAAVQVRKSRPFANVAELYNSFYKYMDELSEDGTRVLVSGVPKPSEQGKPSSLVQPRILGSLARPHGTLHFIGKIGILKSHPDLAGKLASEELTSESAFEQQSAGLGNITTEQRDIINFNNTRYKSKFGFPFIICARENKVQSIIEGLQKRYNNRQDEEIITGINEVKKICKLRILDIVKD